jgi:hypothetical protein
LPKKRKKRKRHFLKSEANPTIESYNASAVNIYNRTSSPMHFENQNIFFLFEKRSSLLQRRRCV